MSRELADDHAFVFTFAMIVKALLDLMIASMLVPLNVCFKTTLTAFIDGKKSGVRRLIISLCRGKQQLWRSQKATPQSPLDTARPDT